MTTPKPPRRSPFSFLRSVKSLFLPSRPAESFVPPLPHLDRSTPFTRSLFNRTFRKRPSRPPHPPGSDLRRSFFDDDDDLVDNVDRRVLSPSRLSISLGTNSGRTAHSNSRLSSAFAHTSPDLSSISSVVPTSCSIAEQHDDTLRSDSRTDLRQSKASPISRLRTKISLTKLVSPNSHPSSSTDTSQAPSSFSYRSYSDNGHAHPYAAQPSEDRSFTPENDPFRKDEVAPAPLALSRSPDSSLGSTSIQVHGESRKHLTGSRSLPVLPSRRSSGPDSPSPSDHALTESGSSHSPSGPSPGTCRAPLPPSQRHNMSPLSLTFPLPPSPQDSVAFAVPTVQVTPPAPGPPPAYPPPLSPLPLEPLPCPHPLGVGSASLSEPLEGLHKEESSKSRLGRDPSKPVQKSTSARRLNSHARADRSPSSFTDQFRAASSRAEDRDFRRTPGKRIPRRKNRPLTPFPLPLLAGQVKHDPTGRLQALEAALCLTSSQADPAIDQTAEAMTDSEVEPDLDFNSSKARKKISVSSAKSAQSAISSFSTASESTTSSATSVATTSTAATTVSPSISTHTSVDKTESQVPIADEDSTIVSVEMYLPQTGRDNHA